MAGTVSSGSDIQPEIMQAAKTDGDAEQPRALLEALAAIENPLMALANRDDANALFRSFYSEYGFLNPPVMANPLEPYNGRDGWRYSVGYCGN